MSFSWEDVEDQFLEWVLDADDDMQYQRKLVAFGAMHGRDPIISLREGDQWLRRRAVRRSEYVGHGVRVVRNGQPFSWVEKRILRWAATEKVESRVPVTVEYLANLLRRNVDEVVTEIEREKNERGGMSPLF